MQTPATKVQDERVGQSGQHCVDCGRATAHKCWDCGCYVCTKCQFIDEGEKRCIRCESKRET